MPRPKRAAAGKAKTKLQEMSSDAEDCLADDQYECQQETKAVKPRSRRRKLNPKNDAPLEPGPSKWRNKQQEPGESDESDDESIFGYKPHSIDESPFDAALRPQDFERDRGFDHRWFAFYPNTKVDPKAPIPDPEKDDEILLYLNSVDMDFDPDKIKDGEVGIPIVKLQMQISRPSLKERPPMGPIYIMYDESDILYLDLPPRPKTGRSPLLKDFDDIWKKHLNN